MDKQSSIETAPIFVVGLPRSGSTLWSRVIARNSDVTAFAEMHYLSVWHRDFRYVLAHDCGDLSQDSNVARLAEIICDESQRVGMTQGPWFWKQMRELGEKGLRESLYTRIIESDKRDIGTIFRILIDEATRCRGAKRALVKFPVYPTYIGRLVEWYPEARVVHISRDPRALAASKTNDPGGVGGWVKRYPWMKSFLPVIGKYFAVLQYILVSHTHSRYKELPNYRLFLYEDLLSEPERVIRELCEFCSLEFQDSMLNPPDGQASSITGRTARGVDAARMEGWRSILSTRESKFIGYITSASMKRFGYDAQKEAAR